MSQRKKILDYKNEFLTSFYKEVKSDYQKHIKNRNSNYHPSLLHKAIRDDDIDTFQSLISKNNFSIDEPIKSSFYERVHVYEIDLRPIKIAAIYKSIKIFKFLFMNDAIIDDNLLDFALYGSDLDIIHLCLCSINRFAKPRIIRVFN